MKTCATCGSTVDVAWNSVREENVCQSCADDYNDSCGSCGADIGESDSYPWHYVTEDCRAVRNPILPT